MSAGVRLLTRSVTMMRWFAGSANSKETVLLAHHVNNDNRPYRLGINKFADGKLMELCRNHDKLDVLLSKLVGKSPCSFIYRGGGRFLRQVFADYKVVNGKVFVTYPTGSKSGCTEEPSVNYEVVAGRLFGKS
jgi:hypothetical protein